MSFSELIGRIDVLSNKQLREERLAVCNECEFNKKDIGLCGKCMCVIKLKVAVKTDECPIGKW